jgi:ribosomal-protein-alanine N-acetyltransferase
MSELVSVRPVTLVSELPVLPPELSVHFHAHLPHLVACALRAAQPVFIATLEKGRVVGLGIADREAAVGSIFAPNPDACERLRVALGTTEFFTEHRHEVLPSVEATAKLAGRTERPRAYNVLETYDVFEVRAPSSPSYDSGVVTRMTEADLSEVATLWREVHGVGGQAWLTAALAEGELGFVARVDGKVVGHALASVVGEEGRLHGNTVSDAHRGKGIGRELTRARVAACVALGATRLIAEVATWNVASAEVLQSLGFAKVGTLWIESAASARTERKVVRR